MVLTEKIYGGEFEQEDVKKGDHSGRSGRGRAHSHRTSPGFALKCKMEFGVLKMGRAKVTFGYFEYF